MTLLDFLSILALIQGLVALSRGRRNLLYALHYRTGVVPEDPVVVFCPVKGAAPDLVANAQSLLDQDHPDYRIVFLVDSRQDPAFDLLGRFHGAEVLVVGLSESSGQKVHSLVQGIETFWDAGRILVFCDADARFPPSWLSHLVAPLSDPRVGATTGYRWYVPEAGNLPSLMRSAWNAAVAGVLGPHAENFAWGGSTAIRRGVFDRAGVLERWEGALSDDYALTAAVRAVGLRIAYVPTCLVPSYGRCSWSELLEFTTRQIRITRIYAPRAWRLGLATYSLFNVAFLWLTLAMFRELRFAAFWLGLYVLAAVRSDARVRSAARAIHDSSICRHRWFYRLSTPLVGLLFEANFLASCISRRIVWKGVSYTLVSPRETRIDRHPT